jgi:phosphoglycolate phosphatase
MVSIQCGDRRFEGIQAVVVDKDGTLSQSEPYLKALARQRADQLQQQVPGISSETFVDLLLTFGLQEQRFDGAGLMAIGSRLENEIATAAHLARMGYPWPEARRVVQTAFDLADSRLGDKAAQMPLLATALPVLQSLAWQRIPVAILSADTSDNIAAFVAQYQLGDWIQAIRGADQRPAKPDPLCFQDLCQELGVLPQATLMIGDASSDMLMAHQAGAAGCIGIQGGWSEPPDIDYADVLIQQWVEIQVVP